MIAAATRDPYVYLCPQCRLSVSSQVWDEVLQQGRAHNALHAHYAPGFRGLANDPATLAELPTPTPPDGDAA